MMVKKKKNNKGSYFILLIFLKSLKAVVYIWQENHQVWLQLGLAV